MSSPHEFDGEFDRALSNTLNQRAAAVRVPDDGRARFDEHLTADMQHRHRRRVVMSVTGVVAVMAVGAGAIAFANGRSSQPSEQTVSAAADQLKIRVPSTPSGLPKLLPIVPEGWVLESAGDYAPEPAVELARRVASRTQVYRTPDGETVIRVDVHTDPNGPSFDPAEAAGSPDAKAVQVRGHAAVLMVNPKGTAGDVVMWAEDPQRLVTVTSTGLVEEKLLAFADNLQPAGDTWEALALPANAALVFDGDPDAAMGYSGPSWQLGYRGPEDLSQPQDPSITVSAAKGTPDALVVFPGPGDHPDQVSVASQPAIYLQGPEADGAQTYCTLVWFDEASGLVMTMSALGMSRNDMISFAASFHSVPDDEWQQAVAEVLPKDEPTGPVEPPVPTQPMAFPGLASGTLPDGRTWTINGTQYRDAPDQNLLCGDLNLTGSSDTLGSACTSLDGSARPGISLGTDGNALLFGATPATATAVSIELSGADPVTAPTVASTDAAIPVRWFVADVGDPQKVTVVVGLDDAGNEVMRIAQPLGPPYPDYEALDKAAKRDVASGNVDGATWTLVAADAPLSDGSGPVTCVTLTFASESAMTCPVVAVGGVNGNDIIDATLAILRKRTFVLAHLEPGVAELCVTLDNDTIVRVPVVPTGSASGSTVAVLHVPEENQAVELHAIGPDGNDMGAVDIGSMQAGFKPYPMALAQDAHNTASISARPGVAYVGSPDTTAG